MRVDGFDWEIIEFVVSWVPYGGPPSDQSVVRFGMDRPTLLSRFCDLVDRLRTAGRPVSPDRQKLVQSAAAYALDLRCSLPGERPEPAVVPVADEVAAGGNWVVQHGVRRWRRAV
jgi:hypothetical protein